LMGHSFGGIVVSAMLNGPGGAGGPGPVDSLALVQGALSLWSYCDDMPVARGRPGYFRAVLASGRVRGPVVTTQSEVDTAVRRWYPLAAGTARQVDFAPSPFPRDGGGGPFGIPGPGPGVGGRDMVALGGGYGVGAG